MGCCVWAFLYAQWVSHFRSSVETQQNYRCGLRWVESAWQSVRMRHITLPRAAGLRRWPLAPAQLHRPVYPAPIYTGEAVRGSADRCPRRPLARRSARRFRGGGSLLGCGLVLDAQQQVLGVDLVAGVVQDAGDDARARRGQHSLHLHRRQHDEGLALGHDVADLDLDVDDDARHGRADGAVLRRGLLTARALGELGELVCDGDEPALAVELHDHLPDAVGRGGRQRDELDEELAALADLEGDLVALLHRLEEEVGR